MSSAEEAVTGVAAQGRVGAGPRRAGAWFAALGLSAMVPVLPLWLFGSDPALRQKAILVALACALCCLVAIALYQRTAGGRRRFHSVAVAEFSGRSGADGAPALGPSALPNLLPSRRSMQWRSLGWYVGASTVLVGLIALAAGSPQRPELMQRIHDAGAVFADVRVEKVSDVERHDPSKGRDFYTSTAVVRLDRGAAGAPVKASVHTDTPDRLAPGDRVSVLYAPAQPHLGAIAGDERSLGHDVRGDTMSTVSAWLFIGAWLVGVGLSLAAVSLRFGFRSFSRLRRADRAVRARCMGPDFWRQGSSKERCLKMVTASSRTAHFLISVTERELHESLNGQQLWLCWDARRGTGGKRFSPRSTPAALVSDDGWVMHGMLKVEDAKLLATEGVSVEKADVGTAVAEEAASERGAKRHLHLWDPRSAWPLFVSPAALTLAVLLIACAALLTCDISGFWRWTTGIGGVIAGSALAYFLTIHESLLSPGKDVG
ncbi:hypothetical protein [Streptomyces kronopolitis]|uniref:hypothetical protein n=1 Tax=Streptomyces kronopolitis TaxID=1612435 RepID=UPI0036B07C92